MNLMDLIDRPKPPIPWSEGAKIPWDDPGFSQRMLKEHLSQDHDLASRRFAKIDAHVAWIHGHLLSGRRTKILDLGCGPGLYTSRLARLGHECTGIDFSPASIAYAINTAREEGLPCTYLHQDIRVAEYGTGFGLAMLIFGEFNVFRPTDARHILRKAHDALTDDGILLLEPSTFESIQEGREGGPSWYSAASGLFSDRPHLCLTENSWDPSSCTTTTRYLVVDAATGDVTRYASSSQAYTRDEYHDLLVDCGFREVTFYPSLTGAVGDPQSELCAIVARRRHVLPFCAHRRTASELPARHAKVGPKEQRASGYQAGRDGKETAVAQRRDHIAGSQHHRPRTQARSQVGGAGHDRPPGRGHEFLAVDREGWAHD